MEGQQPFEVVVEPQSLTAGESIKAELTVTSLMSNECHDVVITFKPPWQFVADKLRSVGCGQLSPGERWVIPLQIESLPSAQGALTLPLKLRWLEGNQASLIDVRLEFDVFPPEPRVAEIGCERAPAKADLKEVTSLDRYLAEAEANLRLIRERKAQYVLETDVPLQLIKEERRLMVRITELKEKLSGLGR